METPSVAGPPPESAAEASERQDIRRAAAGDESAFRRLVERHEDRVYSVALRVTGSAPEAEEAAQDAFVRAWRALPGFRGESRFGTWLHRIALRCALDRAAALKRRRASEVGIDAIEDLPGDPGDAPAGADAGSWFRSRALEALVARLPEAQRAAVALFYVEDQSVEEVARVLGMPENTVKTHLSRARAALRAAWLRREGGR